MKIPLTEVVATTVDGEIFRQSFPPGEYDIGRDPISPIRLKSDRISRPHARLTLTQFDWVIEDLGSANGTYVGGQRIARATLLFPRQAVRLGNVHLELRRVVEENLDESIAPQAMVALHYLPPELRDQRRYQIRRTIALGGMGVVLEAEDRATRRTVAMKTLRTTDSVENVARFVEEAQITAQLQHPNIVPVYELNVNEQDKPYYTMQLVRGESLKQILSAIPQASPEVLQRYSLAELLTIFLKVCDGIAFAHSKGVVHRDLKPENLMIGNFGEVLVMDWGLAKLLGQSASPLPADARITVMVQSARRDDPGGIGTTPGMALGTPQYMSPEQAAGQSHSVDARADIYALGAILYTILTLRPPFDGADSREVMKKVLAGQITPHEPKPGAPPLRHLPGGVVPAALLRVALKAMSLKIEERHQTVPQLQEDIRAFQFGGEEALTTRS